MKIDYSKFNYGIIGALSVIAILLLPVPYSNFKFFLLSLLVLFFLFPLIKINVEIKWIDLSWLAFVCLSFASFFWCINVSLIWSPTFIWLLFFLFLILFRSYWVTYKSIHKQLHWIIISIFYLLLILHLVAIHLDLTFNNEWHDLLSNNSNYSSTYVVALFPFVLFAESKSKFYRFSKFISIVLLLNLLYLTEARGALIALGFVITFYVWQTNENRRLRSVIPIFGTVIILLTLFFVNYTNHTIKTPLVDRYKSELPSRMYLVRGAIATFENRPIFGIGSGNESNFLYKEDVSDVEGLNYPDKIVRLRSHNLYSRILGEYGIIGFLLLFVPIVWLLSKSIANKSKIENASFASLCVYLVTIIFYTTSQSHEYMFSSIHLLAFISISILSTGVRPILTSTRSFKLFLAMSSFCCILWFSYSWICFNQIKNLRITDKIQHEKEFKSIERLYSNVFFNSHSYYHSIAHSIANYYNDNDEIEKAALYYSEAYKAFPGNEQLLMDYALFLYNKYQDKEKALMLVNKVIDIQSNYQPAVDLQVELQR